MSDWIDTLLLGGYNQIADIANSFDEYLEKFMAQGYDFETRDIEF